MCTYEYITGKPGRDTDGMRRLRKQDLSNSVAVVDGGAKNKAYTNRRPRSAHKTTTRIRIGMVKKESEKITTLPYRVMLYVANLTGVRKMAWPESCNNRG